MNIRMKGTRCLILLLGDTSAAKRLPSLAVTLVLQLQTGADIYTGSSEPVSEAVYRLIGGGKGRERKKILVYTTT
ncbi:hypothetical protein BDV28DRAFT_135922 [Aspergillus coremiiformis]|uniref:Uncharacterized protein n=1 Tax=Aspergillus coremiiformis TaxID=138285 RepID=A0A5N6Z7G2_9EURO|nr:hypothetical protein BDV28DRAFT_135922 [Aspergillus coremiiformis]